jgi:hypothetical protein
MHESLGELGPTRDANRTHTPARPNDCGGCGWTHTVYQELCVYPSVSRACRRAWGSAALTAVCCAQLGTVLPILPPWHRLLTARVAPDKRTNRPTTTTQQCGRSRRRAGTPRVREGGPPCRRRSPIAPPPRSLALPHSRRHLRRSQRHRRPIPKLTPYSACHFTSPPPHRRRAGLASERYAISQDDLTDPSLARPRRDSGNPCSRV